jgi:hypothetical protein
MEVVGLSISEMSLRAALVTVDIMQSRPRALRMQA